MTEQPKRKAGRPATGKTVQTRTITLDNGLLEKVKELNPAFKLSPFVNNMLKEELEQLNKAFKSDLSNAF
jgi:hypothetical protein